MMRAGFGRARKALGIDVPIGGRQRARLIVHLVFDEAGAVRNVETSPPPPERMTRGERMALERVQRVAAELRRDARGLAALRDEAEALLELLEELEGAEAQHAGAARRLLAGAAA